MLEHLTSQLHQADRDPMGYFLRTYFPPRVLLYLFSAFIRLVLVVYSGIHDVNYEVKFTDVDYNVFTDAARLLLNGESVYSRHTYRYTPLLALLVTPNVFLYSSFGKLLFCTFDLLTGYMLERILDVKGSLLHGLWLLNPFVIAVSTRGNADCIICFLVIATLYFLERDQLVLSAMFYGLSVHFKLYPIIYALPILLHLSYLDLKPKKGKVSFLKKCWRAFIRLFNQRSCLFGVVSLTVFLLTSLICYYFCGYDYIYEAYLYHYIRMDHRHNFSIYFNYMYHMADSGVKMNAIIAFIPQLACLFGYGLFGYWDLKISMFLQTISFVSLNKVCTCQYYLWWMCLLPLVLSKHPFAHGKFIAQAAALLAFVLSNGAWLYFAYRLEIEGYNTYIMLLFSSVAFVCSQMAIGWVFLMRRVSARTDKEHSS
ncbi:GPI mannosyltransferase I [Babesia ovis]|uniref:GPI mannosyltransferase 1 n=1 Tax=Babesia ovis TaxID=5869 RepID=A0A9W5TCX0_BABOV|nr:GPI mannosyltransferase I [Babesia ovis]